MSALKAAEAAKAAAAEAEKAAKHVIGEIIYARMRAILSIDEKTCCKVTGTMLDSIELDDLQIIVKYQSALDVLIDKTHNAYDCLLKGKAAETPAQIVAAALAVAVAAAKATAAEAAQAAAAEAAKVAPPAKAAPTTAATPVTQAAQSKPDTHDREEFPPLGTKGTRAAAHRQGKQWWQRPAAPTTAQAPAHHQGRPRRQRPATTSAGPRSVVATVAAAMSTTALATAAVFTDPEVLLVYLGSTLQRLWYYTKDVLFEDDLYKRVVRPFYGMLWTTCPNIDEDKFLLFSIKKGHVYTKTERNLKEDYKSFVVVIAYHCVYNVAGLRKHLGIQCMFDDEGKIDDEVRTFMMNVIKGYIAKYHNSSIIVNFDKCVQYIRNHENVRKSGFRNFDPIIDNNVAAVKELFADAIKDKTDAAIDEMRDYMAKMNDTVAKMAKTQEQTAQRLDAVHTEVVELRRTVNAVAEANNRTMKMLARHDVPPPPMSGCVPMPVLKDKQTQ